MSNVALSFDLDISTGSTWLSVTASQAVRASIAYVQELGDFYCGANYYTVRSGLDSFLIQYCVSGCGVLNYGDQTYSVSPGHLYWIDCKPPQEYHTDAHAGNWHVLWVHFYGKAAAAYYRIFLAQNGESPVIAVDGAAEVRSVLEMLIKIYQGGGNSIKDDVQASVLLTSLMAACIQEAGAHGSTSRLPMYVINARNYIERNYTQRITLDDLAHSVSLNKFYLQKLFKSHIGMTPNDYLIHTRLTRAKVLLRNTSHSISEIAAEVGIDNAPYFITVFKKYENCTPSVYRANWYNRKDGI